MSMPRLDLIAKAYHELLDTDLIEDRREYSSQDLHAANPDWTAEEAIYLYELIQNHFDPKADSLYYSQWSTDDAMILAQNITESIHQSFDGWEDWEKIVIERYLHDLGLAQKAAKE